LFFVVREQRTASERAGLAGNLRAEIIQVHTEPGEFHFLVRGRPVEGNGSPLTVGPVDRRIILSPSTAKGLVRLLEAALRDYETAHRPESAPDQSTVEGGREPGQTGRRSILESVRGEEARRLIQSLDGLGVHYGFEQSFKVLPGLILGNRFLAGFNRDSVRQGLDEKMAVICRKLGMPESQMGEFIRGFPEANILLFGYEQGEKESVYKAYLEFGREFERISRENPSNRSPFLIHRGFKWDIADKARHTTANYMCYPHRSVEELLGRLSDVFYSGTPGMPFDIVRGLVELASARMRPDEFLYLEVAEEGNARLSFDVNMYRANLRVSELYPLLMAMCRYFSVPLADFHRIYESVKDLIFGHISGGVDRHGRDFLTVYYGVKGSTL